MQEVSLFSTLNEHEGFLYLDVPDDIIEAFVKMIPNRGLDKPEVATDPTDYVGAHISVMYAEETKRLKKRVREIGEDFQYTLDKMYVTTPENWDDVQEVYFIAVKSPQLEGLRRKYGLRPKLNGHDFHITVAVRTTRKKAQ